MPDSAGSGSSVLSVVKRAETERQVRDALSHLNDPSHLQRHPLTRFVQVESSSRPSNLGRALRQTILDAIESLRPACRKPRARVRRARVRWYQAGSVIPT